MSSSRGTTLMNLAGPTRCCLSGVQPNSSGLEAQDVPKKMALMHVHTRDTQKLGAPRAVAFLHHATTFSTVYFLHFLPSLLSTVSTFYCLHFLLSPLSTFSTFYSLYFLLSPLSRFSTFYCLHFLPSHTFCFLHFLLSPLPDFSPTFSFASVFL